MIADLEAEQAGATREESSAVETKGDAMSDHTPGPWRYKGDGENYMRIFCHNDEGWGDNLCGYCGEANARLIAAAPDLLEALTALLSYTRACEDMLNATPTGQIRLARRAIAKATGKPWDGRDEHTGQLVESWEEGHDE